MQSTAAAAGSLATKLQQQEAKLMEDIKQLAQLLQDTSSTVQSLLHSFTLAHDSAAASKLRSISSMAVGGRDANEQQQPQQPWTSSKLKDILPAVRTAVVSLQECTAAHKEAAARAKLVQTLCAATEAAKDVLACSGYHIVQASGDGSGAAEQQEEPMMNQAAAAAEAEPVRVAQPAAEARMWSPGKSFGKRMRNDAGLLSTDDAAEPFADQLAQPTGGKNMPATTVTESQQLLQHSLDSLTLQQNPLLHMSDDMLMMK